MQLKEFFGLTERGLGDAPWSSDGRGGWIKRKGPQTAQVSVSPRGDGAFVMTSILSIHGRPPERRTELARDEAAAMAGAERMRMALDDRMTA